CATTSARRTHVRPRDPDGADILKSPTIAGDVAVNAGTSATTTPAEQDNASVAASTRTLTATSSRCGTPAGSRATIACSVHIAAATPPAAPTRYSTSVSVSV